MGGQLGHFFDLSAFQQIAHRQVGAGDVAIAQRDDLPIVARLLAVLGRPESPNLVGS